MNELTLNGDKKMTIREISEILELSDDTIKRSVKELYPDLMQHGKTTFLNEGQVTAVKLNLRKTASVIDTPKTNLEKALIIQQALAIQQEIIDTLQKQNEELKPKAVFFDQVADSEDALQMRDVAAVINLPEWGRNKLFEFLREKGILDNRNIPYRSYQDKGYFRVIEQKWTNKEGETQISLKTLVYQQGIDFIIKLIKN